MNVELLSYFLIRVTTWPLRWMSYPTLHRLGKWLGNLCFYLIKSYRKRTLSNLALASDLHLSKEELFSVAKGSFHNLAINMLEYARFSKEKDFSHVIRCENPEKADALYKQGTGIIFFCGHQSNWEALFLDGTARMKGIAIGKAIKNKKLYKWILSIREKMGGKIIPPQNALREGLRSLKQGVFLGIVGDQGMPGSGYSFPFLGRRAWNSTAPALLSYKTGAPIIVATTKRTRDGYLIHYSDPIFPNLSEAKETEVSRLMDLSLSLLEKSIRQNPQEWLWQHNRYKQQTPKFLYKKFRQDSIAIILPKETGSLLAHLPTFRKIFPQDFLFLIVPESLRNTPLISAEEIFYYQDLEETLREDYRFKMVFDFTSYKRIKAHYKKLSAFQVLTIHDLKKLASQYLKEEKLHDLSELLFHALCRQEQIPFLKEEKPYAS